MQYTEFLMLNSVLIGRTTCGFVDNAASQTFSTSNGGFKGDIGDSDVFTKYYINFVNIIYFC